jgi:hypothetical protein
LKRRLKITKFTPCPVDDGDELYPNGIFVFNITKMTDFIQVNDITRELVEVKDFTLGSSTFNEFHVASVDVTKPIIVAEISPGRYNVIDGNHRVEKARRMGIEKLPAYRLSPEQHLQFLTSELGYKAYIQYWNDKLKALKLVVRI